MTETSNHFCDYTQHQLTFNYSGLESLSFFEYYGILSGDSIENRVQAHEEELSLLPIHQSKCMEGREEME